MRNNKPDEGRRAIKAVIAALRPFMRRLGFGGRGNSFHRLVDGVWQTVSVFYNKGWINVQLDAASLSVRQSLGHHADVLLGSSADEHEPPKGGDVEPLCVGSWDWNAHPESSLSEMQSALRFGIRDHFGTLSSEDALLKRVGPGLVKAVLYALRGDRPGVTRECANIRRDCIHRGVMDPSLERWAHAAGCLTALDLARDWRLQVRLVHQVLERADPAYKIDPRVLTDEYYEELARNAAATANGLSPRERNERIRETLQYDDDPGLTMIINGVTYSREELVTLLDVAREDPSESPGA